MKCDYCDEFANPLIEFEEGTGWYCTPECYLAALKEDKEENTIKCEYDTQ